MSYFIYSILVFFGYSLRSVSGSTVLSSRKTLRISSKLERYKFYGFDFRHCLEKNEEDIVKKLEIASYFRRLEVIGLLERQDLSLEEKQSILRKYELPMSTSLTSEISPGNIRNGGLFDDWDRTV